MQLQKVYNKTLASIYEAIMKRGSKLTQDAVVIENGIEPRKGKVNIALSGSNR